MKRLAILVCMALLLAGGVCNEDEWPQWRGTYLRGPGFAKERR